MKPIDRSPEGAIRLDLPSHEIKVKRFDGRAWRITGIITIYMPTLKAYRVVSREYVKQGGGEYPKDTTLAEFPDLATVETWLTAYLQLTK